LDAGGVFDFGVAWQRQRAIAKRKFEEALKEVVLPIAALLARIRKLVPPDQDGHYDEIVRGFGVGELRPPVPPMSDRELGRAIAGFLENAPSAETLSSLGRRFNPFSGV
jgi:hypothetical protein